MRTAICTLAEGNYFSGVGALVNSLIANGFKGDVYVGYRGFLPKWSNSSQKIQLEGWDNCSKLTLPNDTCIYFLKLDTALHFTNYKPKFLIDLTSTCCKDYDAIAYFDPDIVVCRNWIYFEDWMQYGVAVTHDIIMNDMPSSHPLRKKWIKIGNENGYTINHQILSYINAGFCGLHKRFWSFPILWNEFINISANDYNANLSRLRTHARPNPFFYPDQDALNIALMFYSGDISEIGPEGMAFKYGVVAMAHAVGSPKPWNKKYLLSFLSGYSPTYADKKFWYYANTTIKIFSLSTYQFKRMTISLISFVGRFYNRN